MFHHACKLGCEGIVSKRLGATPAAAGARAPVPSIPPRIANQPIADLELR